MNWLDLIILIPLIGGLFSGYKNGLIGEVASLAALILGIWGAVKFSHWTANLLNTWGIESQYMHIISFVITFIIIVVVIQIVAKMLRELVKALALGWIDRIAGIGFGMIKAILITSVLLFVIDYIDQRKNFVPADAKQESMLFRPMADLIPNLLPFLNIQNIEKELDQIKDKDADTEII